MSDYTGPIGGLDEWDLSGLGGGGGTGGLGDQWDLSGAPADPGFFDKGGGFGTAMGQLKTGLAGLKAPASAAGGSSGGGGGAPSLGGGGAQAHQGAGVAELIQLLQQLRARREAMMQANISPTQPRGPAGLLGA